MKCIIAGSRDLEIFRDKERVWVVADAAAKSGFAITEVVCGGARGIDLAGKLWAETLMDPIPVKLFMPDWDRLGKVAGFARNEDMALYAEALIAIRQNESRGTTHMIKLAIERGLAVFVMDYEGPRTNEPKIWAANR